MAAQPEDMQYEVYGRITDYFTNEPVKNATVSLLSAADSTVLHTCIVDSLKSPFFFGMFTLPVKEKGKYLVRTSSVGYKTDYTPLVKKYKREQFQNMLRIKLRPESHVLDEVTVTGTRIKMVMRGDTLVYNADAFNLAEGSMLDALIRQLPGAELSKDGEIKVNGRHIDNLLVDGRDFFAGDPKAALENLPAYTVNKVKVFDRTGKVTKMMGRDMGDNKYVMDVRLKKNYAVGLMGNVEAAGGGSLPQALRPEALSQGESSARYLLKGTATRTVGNQRLSAAVNLNNLNDREHDMNTLRSSSPQAESGVHTTRSLQLGYSLGGFEDTFFLQGGLRGSANSSLTETWTSSETYLTGGDTYNRSAQSSHNKSKDVAADVTTTYSSDRLVLFGIGNLAYNKGDTWGNSRSAAFDADPAVYGDLLDDLFLNPDRYRLLTLNRQQSLSKGKSDNISASATVNGNVKVRADMVNITLTTSYTHSTNDNFQLTDLNYVKREGQRDFRNNYTSAPSSNFTGGVTAQYNIGIGRRHNLELNYGYTYTHSQNDNSLYRLDRLAGHDSTQIDLLPSTTAALASVIDAANSYDATRNDHDQKLGISLRLVPRFLGTGNITLNVPVSYIRQQYDYRRETSQHLTQNHWLCNPSMIITYQPSREEAIKNGQQPSQTMVYGQLTANLETQVPDITSMVTYRDDSDPLNVRLSGGNGLRNTRQLSLSANISLTKANTARKFIHAGINYHRTYDAIATSMVYDKQSGRTTTQPVNVNGNWSASSNIRTGLESIKKPKLRISNDLNLSYNHSVDLNSVEGMQQGQSVVHNTHLIDQLSASWEFGKGNQVEINGGGGWNRVSGERDDFQTINAGNFSYGASALLQLPWKLQLSTLLSRYSHRGYSDPQMNTDELIWNAKLSRPLIKGKLTASLEGFDLLGQLSNRRYTINAQGRSETYTNIISQYVLVRLTYRFNKIPKRK